MSRGQNHEGVPAGIAHAIQENEKQHLLGGSLERENHLLSDEQPHADVGGEAWGTFLDC